MKNAELYAPLQDLRTSECTRQGYRDISLLEICMSTLLREISRIRFRSGTSNPEELLRGSHRQQCKDCYHQLALQTIAESICRMMTFADGPGLTALDSTASFHVSTEPGAARPRQRGLENRKRYKVFRERIHYARRMQGA